MNRILSIICLSFLFLLTGCSNTDEKQEIKDMAYSYLIATANYRIDEAMPFGTSATQESLTYLKESVIPVTDTAYMSANTPAEIVIDEIVIEGDTSWISYTKTTPIKTLKATVPAIKENGKWLIDLPLLKPEPQEEVRISVPLSKDFKE